MKKLVLVLALVCATCVVSCEEENQYDENGELIPPTPMDYGKLAKTIAQYGLGLFGVGMLAISATKTFGGLSYPAARLSLTSLLRTNPNQAEQVARNMKDSFGEALGTAMKTAAMIGIPDAAAISATTTPTYDGHAQAIASRWGGLISKGKLYVVAALGGFALGVSKGEFPIISFLLALLAIGAFVRVYMYKGEVESTIVRARHELIPEVDRAMASGRYQFPPPKQQP